MKPSSSTRFTIGQVMAGIAILASLLAIPGIVVSPDRTVTVCLVGLLTALVVLITFFEMAFGRPCPSCDRWTLRRLARHRSYLQCSACRGRFKRFGFGPWLDASGPDDAARFRKPSEAGVWKGFVIPVDLAGTTCGELLRSKRGRNLPAVVKRQPRRTARMRADEDATRKVRKALSRLRGLRR